MSPGAGNSGTKIRLTGLDAARFLAFCGMVLVNFRIAAQVSGGADFPSALTNAMEGRAAALFVILAGVGIALAEPAASLMLKRAAFLFVIGMINMTIFDADILHFYALYFIVGTAFLSTPDRGLWVGAAVFILLGCLGLVLLDYDKGWNWETYSYADVWTLAGFLRHSFFNGWHPVVPWVAFLLIGMRIGRMDLQDASTLNRLVWGGALAALAALVPQFLTQDPELRLLLGTEAIPPGPFYILAGTGTACMTIGIILKAMPYLDKWRLSSWLVIPGRQSLTLYVLHIILGMGVLEEFGLLNGSLTTWQIFAISMIFCLLSSVYARLWALGFSRGPLEALMRRVAG
ncbi:DUF418 domain-containing protein [Primorskyibacter sp. S87]|uniref:DUF418 domain-containing protein n=1 Tax=Primorskyibacter sp. S87 TaxID=3415126 RepID=UPI003C7E33C1